MDSVAPGKIIFLLLYVFLISKASTFQNLFDITDTYIVCLFILHYVLSVVYK